MYRLSKTSLLGWIAAWHSPPVKSLSWTRRFLKIVKGERDRPSLEILLTQNIGADSDNLWRFHHFYGDCLLLPVNRAPLYPRPSFPAPLWTENGPPPLPRDNFFPTETDRSWVGVQTYVQESYVWNRWQEQEE